MTLRTLNPSETSQPVIVQNIRQLIQYVQQLAFSNLAGKASLTSQVTGVLPVANGGTGAATETSNIVFAGPSSGSAAAPLFRLLVAADLPSAVKFGFNSRNMTSTSGNVSYTGFGFKPSLVVFIGNISTGQLGTIGTDDGGSPRCYIQNSGSWGTDGAASMFFSADGGATSQTAAVVSFDADGFTLAWTKTGSPAAGTGFFSAVAFR